MCEVQPSEFSDSRPYFAHIAGRWDELRAQMYTDAVRETALSRAALFPGAVVADVGAGTGFLARGLVSQARKVYVIDSSPEMLAVARKNLAAFNNVEYCQADGRRLPLPDACLDAALANMYLHHVPDPLAAISEMVRVLKPGGRLVITDLDEHPYTWLREAHHDIWLGFDREQVRAWFETAGLIDVWVESTGERCCAAAEAQEAGAQVTVFVAVGTNPPRTGNKETEKALVNSARLSDLKQLVKKGGCGQNERLQRASRAVPRHCVPKFLSS